MPELPDVTVYIEALEGRIVGRQLERVRLASPFVLRSFDPPLAAIEGRTVQALRRIGKRIVLDFGDELYAVHPPHDRRPPAVARAGREEEAPGIVASFEFANGTLHFTEAGTRKRASLTLVRGAQALAALDPGGIEPLAASFEDFDAALRRESHTLKRALTDPHLFSGIGNAYSDEILHAARSSRPLKLTRSLTEEEARRLHKAVRTTLASWTDILRAESQARFPDKVTAFRPGMAVHGRYKQPCPVCGSPVQRIVYAENECNYCATCQTGGRLLADRSLSRLLKDDWPKTIDEL